MTQDVLNKIYEYHAQGLSDNEIAKKIGGYHRGTISHHRRKAGLEANGQTTQKKYIR